MKLTTILAVGIAAFLTVAVAFQSARAQETQKAVDAEQWAHLTGDLPMVIGCEKGMAQVELTGRPPVYFFVTAECDRCRELAASTFKNSDVVKALEHFTPILVDGDTEKEIVRKFGVSAYPTTMFAKTNGKPVSMFAGPAKAKDFLAVVTSAAKKAKKGRGSKQYRALLKADQELTKALEAKQVRRAFAAIKKAEATELDHALVERARAAKHELMERGQRALTSAKDAMDGGDAASAASSLRELSLDYKGTPVGDRASELLAQLRDTESEE